MRARGLIVKSTSAWGKTGQRDVPTSASNMLQRCRSGSESKINQGKSRTQVCLA